MKYLKGKGKKRISFKIAFKKYLGIKLSKEVKDLYAENYKTQKRETEDPKKQKDIPCLWTGRSNV